MMHSHTHPACSPRSHLLLALRHFQAERYKRSGEEAAAKLATRDGELLAARKEVDQARRAASAVQTDQRNREVCVYVWAGVSASTVCVPQAYPSRSGG
jgi:hypothetical protein